ncbi:RNA polymerase sigma factor [Dictyobacter aurantiacus]|uniref:ECF RNA polymerase sigma factor SigW n=1 Tax=Dictyobacter aurantiacus TaxID=1936993 RepID=A0A401ZEY1_9CHLR|nr:sigma-70 family RNA polymerase sigma factor [Dictyobacter aurantiacus]GCE05425.1 ECF RNA polymerase sigma factor SigW [Dictyobacter aurantiacus]
MHQQNADLVTLLAADLKSNFHLVVLHYQPHLYGFALRQTGNVQDAEEIAQEAFIQAYFAIANYPSQRIKMLVLQPWLYKIALNIFYKRLRQEKLQLIQLDMEEEDGYTQFADEAICQPDYLFERKESRHEVEALLMTLPLQYREAINLYYFAGFSYREIAEMQQLPMGTVKSNLHRGLSLLRKILAMQQKGNRGGAQ